MTRDRAFCSEKCHRSVTRDRAFCSALTHVGYSLTEAYAADHLHHISLLKLPHLDIQHAMVQAVKLKRTSKCHFSIYSKNFCRVVKWECTQELLLRDVLVQLAVNSSLLCSWILCTRHVPAERYSRDRHRPMGVTVRLLCCFQTHTGA